MELKRPTWRSQRTLFFLNPIVRLTREVPVANGRIKRNGFTVRKVSFQSLGRAVLTTFSPHPQQAFMNHRSIDIET